MPENKIQKHGKRRRGRPPVHYGYALLTRGGPPHDRVIAAQVSNIRQGLIADLGGEDNITTAQEVLVDRAIARLGLILMLEKFGREHGIFTKSGDVHNVFIKVYLPSMTGLRAELLALGIERRELQSEPRLADYIVQASNMSGETGKGQPGAQEKPQDGPDKGDKGNGEGSLTD